MSSIALRIRNAFDAAREHQARLHGRTLTPFDSDVGRSVCQAALLAMDDVTNGRSDKIFRVVSAPTGGGKTTSVAAFISAALTTVPDFSCAYVVETIRQADETGQLIAELVGADKVTVWSSAHDAKLTPEERHRLMEEHGTLRMAPSLRSQMERSLVVVVTHQLWKKEMARRREDGVRFFRGARRSVVFVDEHPALVKLIERTPGDLMKARDVIYQADPDNNLVTLLDEITERADKAFKSNGVTYSPVELVTSDEGHMFGSIRSARALLPSDATVGEASVAALEATFRFLYQASRGCAFLSRQGRSLVAYEVEFEPGPGHVLLDATADLTGMTALMTGMEHVDVPEVDYSNLDIVHVPQPGEFKYVSEVAAKAKTARPYAEWVRRTVLEHTSPDDRVLVVVHKALLDHEYLDRAEDPDQPLDWNSRKVNTLWWGIGIGSNKYKEISNVFLFSEFFLPRKAAIADVHGWTGRPLTAEGLKDANRPHEPAGDYLQAYEGHLARWSKQLACRGSVRNIDAEGKCGAMKLVTTMSLQRLMKLLPRMFPGATAPKLLGGDADMSSKVDRLAHLLSSANDEVLWSDEIERLTGIRSGDLRRALTGNSTICHAAEHYGWELVSARELGFPGKRKALRRSSHVQAAA